METNILEIRGLRKEYDAFSLKDVSLSVPRGSIMGFIGRNGAGKSTTIKSILSMIPIDGGYITVNGIDAVADEIAVKRIIGYVGEDARLYGEVRCDELGRFVKKFYPTWDEALYRDLVRRFGLDLRKRVSELSRGTRTKLALTLALSHRPELLVLDEPTSGLDPVVRNEVLEILADAVRDNGCSVFFSSHITEDIVRVADVVTYIDDGLILLSDTKDHIREGYSRVDFDGTIPEAMRSELGFCRGASCIVADRARFDALCARVGLDPSTLHAEPAALDDVLMFLVGDRTTDAADSGN